MTSQDRGHRPREGRLLLVCVVAVLVVLAGLCCLCGNVWLDLGQLPGISVRRNG